MDFIKKGQENFERLPNTKKLILIMIVIVVLVLIISMFTSKKHYTNVINHSTNKIEKLENNDVTENKATEEANKPDESVQTLNLSPEKVNITLFYAEWCGHCKRFMKETWNELKEKYTDNADVQLNELNCTNIKSAIQTPAGKEIEGFPTLIINYKDKNGEYLEDEYRGGRSVQHLTAFLEKFTTEIKGGNVKDEVK